MSSPAKDLTTAEPRNVAEFQPPDTARMMEIAISQGEAGVAALERLVAMRERERDYQAEVMFNAAMRAAQSEMGRVSANAHNPQTRSNYATYDKLDRALRSIYTRHGFSLSFDTGKVEDDTLPVRCFVSHEMGHTREYSIPMDCSGKGAKGGDVMTKTHARGSAASYGMRYLLKLIFNVAIGEDDDDGAGAGPAEEEVITEEQAATLRDLAEEVGADMPKFLKWLGVEKVTEIKASRYRKAVRGLEAKRG